MHIRKSFKSLFCTRLSLYRLLYSILSFLLKKEEVLAMCNTQEDLYGNLTTVYNELDYSKKYFLYSEGFCFKKDIATIYHLAKARVIILDTINRYIRLLDISKKTNVIFCGHGGGVYKKMGYTAPPPDIDLSSKKFKKIDSFYKKISDVVSSFENKELNTYLVQNYKISESNILPFGLPRTDGLYSLDYASIKDEYTSSFPKLRGKLLILYAPTYRTTESGRHSPIFLDEKVLEKELTLEYQILFRGHPTLGGTLLPDSWIDVSSWPQYKCLAIADILITDYSSILFDFSFFRKPIYLLIPDAEAYMKKELALWFSPQELMKEYACASTAELAKKINAPPIDPPNIWEIHMNACDGNAGKRLAQYILASVIIKNKKDGTAVVRVGKS